MQAEEHADPPRPDVAELAALIGGSPAGVAVLDADLRYVYVNQAFERLNGMPAAAHLGRTADDVLAEVDVRTDVVHRVLGDGRARAVTVGARTRTDPAVVRRSWRISYHRVEEGGRVLGLVGIAQEITSTQDDREELERARSYVALLDSAAASIGTSLDADATCQELAEFVVPVMADIAVVEVLPESGGRADVSRRPGRCACGARGWRSSPSWPRASRGSAERVRTSTIRRTPRWPGA